MQVYRATKDDAMSRSTADSCATTKGDDRRGVGRNRDSLTSLASYRLFNATALLINGRRLFGFVLAYMQADLAGGQNTQVAVAIAIEMYCCRCQRGTLLS